MQELEYCKSCSYFDYYNTCVETNRCLVYEFVVVDYKGFVAGYAEGFKCAEEISQKKGETS